MLRFGFQIVGLMLTFMVFALFYKKTRMLFETDKAFSYLSVAMLIYISCDIGVIYSLELLQQGIMNELTSQIVCKSYLISFVLMAYCVLKYFEAVAQIDVKVKSTRFWMDVVPLILHAIAVVFLDTSAFYLSESTYAKGACVQITYVIVFYYFIMSAYGLLKKMTFIQPLRALYGTVFGVIITIAVLAQYIIEDMYSISLGASLALLYLYISLENPDDYTDSKTEAFNGYTFEIWIKQQIEKGTEYNLCLFSFPDEEYMKKRIGTLVYDRFLATVVLVLRNLRIGRVFTLESGEFVVASKITEIEEKLYMPIKRSIIRLCEDYPGFTTKMIRYGSMENLDTYEDMESFQQDWGYFLDYLKQQEPDMLHKLDESVIAHRKEEEYIVASMVKAIEEDGIMVHYQPIYSVKKKGFHTAEALVRIKDLDGNFMRPDIFIPIAEQRGFILTIGEAVFRKVCDFVKRAKLQERGFDYVEINLSIVQCMQENLSSQLTEIMNEYNIESGFISLEITETAAVRSEQMLLKNMYRLTQHGLAFALDDFGSGYSNLDYIINLPFGLVKLDKSLVWDSLKDEKSKTLFENSIAMFGNMRLSMVAEGVETEEQAKYLKSLGIEYLQGFYFSKPVCEEDFLELIDNKSGGAVYV